MSNVQKYENVLKLRMVGDKPLVEICKEVGVSYQSFHKWYKKYKKGEEGHAGKVKIVLFVSVAEIVDAVVNGKKVYPISIMEMIKSLPEEERKKIAHELGQKHLSALTGSMGDGKRDVLDLSNS